MKDEQQIILSPRCIKRAKRKTTHRQTILQKTRQKTRRRSYNLEEKNFKIIFRQKVYIFRAFFLITLYGSKYIFLNTIVTEIYSSFIRTFGGHIIIILCRQEREAQNSTFSSSSTNLVPIQVFKSEPPQVYNIIDVKVLVFTVAEEYMTHFTKRNLVNIVHAK